MMALTVGGACFGIAFLLGTFVEYFLHRCMHWGWIAAEAHRTHHKNNNPQGWSKEFLDYCKAVVPVCWVGFFLSVPAGTGFGLGCLAYAVLAAYAHQVQHDRPDLVFWLPRPVHYLHHEYGMVHHNFGILVDLWDRLFGTYKKVEGPRSPEGAKRSWRDYLDIKW